MAYKGLTAFLIEEWYNELIPAHTTMTYTLYNDDFQPLVDKLGSALNDTDYNQALRELQELEIETMYKLPVYTANVAMYVRTSRVSIPDDIIFGNTRYRCDLKLSE